MQLFYIFIPAVFTKFFILEHPVNFINADDQCQLHDARLAEISQLDHTEATSVLYESGVKKGAWIHSFKGETFGGRLYLTVPEMFADEPKGGPIIRAKGDNYEGSDIDLAILCEQ